MGSKWRIGKVTTSRSGAATFTVVSLERRNRQLILKRYTPGCQWKLGETGCGVNLASYTDNVTVVSSSDLRTIVLSGPSPARADDYYNLGAIKFLTGDNAGLAYDVRDWVQSSGTIRLMNSLKRPVQAGDTATVHAGCDKTTGNAGCARFSNIARRFAFDYLPDENLTFPQVTTTGANTSVSSTPQPAGGAGLWLGTYNNSGGFV